MSGVHRGLVAAGMAVGLLMVPLVAWSAAGFFSDVPTTHPFYEEIESIRNAGITTGSTECDPDVFPAYCPDSLVRRDAMAAFMERGFGRAAHDSGGIGGLANNSAPTTLASVTIEAGATGTGGGFVVLIGSATFYTTDVADCPCEVFAFIAGPAGTSSYGYDDLAGVAAGSGYSNASVSLNAVFPLAADTAGTYDLVVGLNDNDADAVTVVGDLSAIYVPFGYDGGGILSPAAEVPDAEPFDSSKG